MEAEQEKLPVNAMACLYCPEDSNVKAEADKLAALSPYKQHGEVEDICFIKGYSAKIRFQKLQC